jgi:hypothetical protein
MTILLIVFQIIIILTLVPYGYSGDNAILMTSACVIHSGARMYKDFFEQHGPLMITTVSWIYKLINGCSLYIPRYVFYIMFCAVLWLIVKYSKSVKTALFLLLMYALMSVSYSTTAVLSESWMTIVSLMTFLLLFFHKQLPKILFWVLFSLVELSFFLESPVYIPCGLILLLYFLIDSRYNKETLLLTSFLPSIIFLLLFVSIKDYWHLVYVFNWQYYKAVSGWGPGLYWQYFTNTTNAVGQLFTTATFWKDTSRYRTLLEITIIVTCVALQIKNILTRKTTRVVIFNILIAFALFIRPDSYHMTPFLFFLLAQIVYFFPNKNIAPIIISVILLLGVRVFYSPDRYNFNALYEDRINYYNRLIVKNTKPDDSILLFTGQPDSYIATHHLPGSYYFSNLPWVGIIPGVQVRLFNDIMNNSIKFILIQPTGSTLAGHPADSYSKKTIDFLDADPLYRLVQLPDNVRMYLRMY